jgi:signal transduction histidine kinase
MLSARAGEESRVEGMEAGADDYLIKPFSARELLARVGAHLQMARMRHEASEAVERRAAQFKTLFDRLPLGVYLVDADLRIREINPIARPAFAAIPGGAVGRDLSEVLHLLLEDSYANEIVTIFRRTLETGAPHIVTERARVRAGHDDPEYFEWRVDRIPLPEGRYGVVCSFRDISAQVIARKLLEQTQEALKDADRRKDEFLAMLAHELRGPLAPLGNMLEILKHADGDLDLLRQARDTMERQFTQLVRLVDDLLDVGRITSNRLELRKERTELAPILREVVENGRVMTECFAHEVTLTLPAEPVSVNADPTRLAQVFHNLFHNACKYTPPGGHVRITAERHGEEVAVRVEDDGIGIAPSDIGSVFDMFVQVDKSLERSQGGLGIGLTLVKQLVEMHGGSVEARSEGLGRGTVFTVRLPILVEKTALESLPVVAAPVGVVSRRFLVVDDNVDSAESLTTLLSITGHETRTEHDGLAAVAAAETFRPEVILLDIGLPKLNGLAAARRIREQPWGKAMVLIALTGWGQEENRRHSKEAGFDAHMTKPVDLDALMKLLATFAGQEDRPR